MMRRAVRLHVTRSLQGHGANWMTEPRSDPKERRICPVLDPLGANLKVCLSSACVRVSP